MNSTHRRREKSKKGAIDIEIENNNKITPPTPI
jgi:hypothetical protein